MSDARAQHWHRWFAINVFWLVFVVVTFALMGTFGFDTMGRFALSIPTSFVQLVLILLAVWLRPRHEPPKSSGTAGSARSGWSWLLTPLLHAGLGDPDRPAPGRLYWLVIAAVALPWTIVMVHRGVHYVLRAPDPETGAKPDRAGRWSPSIDRGIRMVLIVAGAVFLAHVWGLDLSIDDGERQRSPTASCAARSTPPSSSLPPISAGASSRR